ncbi:MAG TPA: integrin alpha [Actinomycetota bacterium]|nr:integrin alpha [Actinomycetota bacterium]
MRRIAAATAIAVAALGAPSATAAPVDLLAQGGATGDAAGFSVAVAGDVNGDRRRDLVIGAPQPRSLPGCPGPGAAYVVFGADRRQTVDLGDPGAAGFVIRGEPGSGLGRSVDGAGDVNGDGLADVVVGAPNASPRGRTSAGSAFVVLGKRTRDPVDVGTPGDWGYRIDGAEAMSDCEPGGNAGHGVTGLGDVTGDGAPDLAVAAPLSTFRGRRYGGAVHILHGGGLRDVDLAEPAMGGIVGGGANGVSASMAGDVDGDGTSDVAIADSDASPLNRLAAGAVYVISGGASGDVVDLAEPPKDSMGVAGAEGTSGFPGAANPDALGVTHTALGDWDRDGRDDLAIAALGAGAKDRGATYVVFGRPFGTTVDTSRGGRSIVTVKDASAVLGTADVRGDRRRELLVRKGRRLVVVGPRRARRTSARVVPGVRLPAEAAHVTLVVVGGARRREAWLLRGAPTRDPLGRPDAGTVVLNRIRLPGR